MQTITIQEEKLPSGLTILKIPCPGLHAITNFLVIRSGSRYEDESNAGLAHFLEHMVFKGTKSFANTKLIAEAIEGIGGYFNAWTSNDHTAYWNVVPSRHWQRGAMMPFELAFTSTLRDEDLERERGVIIEEIRRMQDDPASYVDDLSGPLLFGGYELGRSVIGTEESIKAMKIEQFRAYKEQYYHPSQAVFIAIGDVADLDLASVVGPYVADYPVKPVTMPKLYTDTSHSALKVLNKPTDQTHFMLSVAHPSLGLKSNELAQAAVLNAVLGRGMSSRLFLNIREAKGLAYAINSHYVPFEETGVFVIYGGVNTTKIHQTLEALDHEFNELQQVLVGSEELTKAKNLVTGSYDLSADRPVDLAQWYATGRLLGQQKTMAEAKKEVEAVTAAQVQQLAQKLFPKSQQTLAVIGPYDSDQAFREFLQLTGPKTV
jgi:predicted Zn-dependent peptidase